MHEASPHCSACKSAFCEALMQEYFSLFYSPTSRMRQQGVARGVRERKGATAQACVLFEVHRQCQWGRPMTQGREAMGAALGKMPWETSRVFNPPHFDALSQPLKQAGGHIAAGGNWGGGLLEWGSVTSHYSEHPEMHLWFVASCRTGNGIETTETAVGKWSRLTQQVDSCECGARRRGAWQGCAAGRSSGSNEDWHLNDSSSLFGDDAIHSRQRHIDPHMDRN